MNALRERKKQMENDAWQEEMTKRKKRVRHLKTVIMATAAVVLLLSAALLWQVRQLRLELTVDSADELFVEFGSDFTVPKAQAVFGGWLFGMGARPVDVEQSGDVDTGSLGDYRLYYSCQHIFDYWLGQDTYTQSQAVTVHVVDTQPPEIALVSDPDAFTVPGQAYAEEGFSAVDNCDGNITDLVECFIEGDTVTYTVSDSSGNVASATRQIVFYDPEPPVLELRGGTELTVNQWLTYVDPGFTATDNCDGDITDRVTVEGSVDMQTPGTYVLTYSVSDAYENAVTVERQVTVRECSWTPALPMGTFDTPVQPEEKTIYLTFDDGPSIYTPKLLEILEKYDVKATFFVINSECIEYVRDIAAAGHTVAMHANSHSYSWVYSGDNAYFNDLYAIQSRIYEYTGQRPTILRFPGGTSNTVSRSYSKGIMSRITARLKQMGYRYFDWNVDSHDASDGKSTQAVYNNVIKGITGKKVAVVLQHDIFEFSINAVEDIILWGLENGYTFKALDTTSPMCIHGLNN